MITLPAYSKNPALHQHSQAFLGVGGWVTIFLINFNVILWLRWITISTSYFASAPFSFYCCIQSTRSKHSFSLMYSPSHAIICPSRYLSVRIKRAKPARVLEDCTRLILWSLETSGKPQTSQVLSHLLSSLPEAPNSSFRFAVVGVEPRGTAPLSPILSPFCFLCGDRVLLDHFGFPILLP